jgi:hypothetical protein
MVINRSPAMMRELWHSLSAGGLLLATLFFAASLTPTLLPRTFLTQGLLSGCSLAAGTSPRRYFRQLKLSQVLLGFCCPMLEHPSSKVALSFRKRTIVFSMH